MHKFCCTVTKEKWVVYSHLFPISSEIYHLHIWQPFLLCEQRAKWKALFRTYQFPSYKKKGKGFSTKSGLASWHFQLEIGGKCHRHPITYWHALELHIKLKSPATAMLATSPKVMGGSQHQAFLKEAYFTVSLVSIYTPCRRNLKRRCPWFSSI
jgi:hypothetical protein